MAARLSIRIACAAALLVIGAVTGPVLIALVVALLSRTHQGEYVPSGLAYGPGEAAQLLYRAYEPYRPPPPRTTALVLPKWHWLDCGYPQLAESPVRLSDDLRKIVESSRPAETTLLVAFTQAHQADEERAIVERIDRATSTFSAVFLRQCIQGTIARRYCAGQVTDLLDGDARPAIAYDYVETSDRQEARCLMLDGIAARNGLPLAERSPPENDRGD